MNANNILIEMMAVTDTLPSLFVSHGAPNLPLTDCSARTFLSQLGERLPLPKAILVISPHWMTSVPTLGTAGQMRAIYDFRGFERSLYQLQYNPPGFSDELAQTVLNRLALAEFPTAIDSDRGLDHGAWVPLSLVFPQANIPVMPLSLPAHWSPAQLVRLGEALSGLRKEGVLIVASGSATHNLGSLGGRAVYAETPDWVSGFEAWLVETLEQGNWDGLLDYENAPNAKENHPTTEHLLPLFVAVGASVRKTGKTLHRSYTYGVISMASFSFS
ncbi:MAG: class III extradiol ring-cleavage dioxygenase [Cyanobacteria bacterium P01_D01_bin.105]